MGPPNAAMWLCAYECSSRYSGLARVRAILWFLWFIVGIANEPWPDSVRTLQIPLLKGWEMGLPWPDSSASTLSTLSFPQPNPDRSPTPARPLSSSNLPTPSSHRFISSEEPSTRRPLLENNADERVPPRFAGDRCHPGVGGSSAPSHDDGGGPASSARGLPARGPLPRGPFFGGPQPFEPPVHHWHCYWPPRSRSQGLPRWQSANGTGEFLRSRNYSQGRRRQRLQLAQPQSASSAARSR